MGEFEVDGEEKLIVAAEYLIKELRSVISEDRDEEDEIDEVEQRLNVVSEKIMTRDVDESMIWDFGSDEGNLYLDAVNELRSLIDRIDGSSNGTEKLSLRKAHDVLQTAMARLEEEFKHLLVENRLPFELEHSSFRSIEADHGVEEGSVASFGAASTEDLILGSSNSRRNSVEIVVDLINPDVISDLKNIADTMIASGYDRECIQVCTMVRKDALDEFLYNYEVEKLSIEDVLKMDWATLNTNIKKWVRVMRKLVQIYLLSEKSLGNQIFGELNEIGLICFVDTVKAPMMLLLNFGEAVSLGPRQPEKLLRILEMYELASELLPEIDALFTDHPGSSVKSEYREVMRRLGDCARATFLEFKSKIASDVSSHPFPGGAIHPLTNYVMNYLMALTDYSYTLNSLLMEHDDVEDLTIPPSPDIINPVMVEEESTYENSSSPEKFLAMTRHFYTITSVLEANLQEKSKLYRDVSLRHIFLLNNIHYMSRKVLKSELRHIFGDKWNRKHTWKFQQQATEYERATWLPVLSFLKEDSSGSGSGSGSGSRNLRPRERFQGFNTAFEEVYKTQTGWLISDESLREDVRTKASMWVIQAYWTFYSRHKNSVGDRYIKYSTDDLEKLLLDLFAGSSKSLNNSYRR
ncbi:Exocyst complex component EXO70E2 [Cardamine amara subsp. amara]|uniref:Exocyst subunit Exo70 family protein n=1 Tax=Cardamine amara subsp. amara TaxID=228776 RepID=A0ABD1C1W4_CARAN